jgi:phosphate transport system ATP-binding protein
MTSKILEIHPLQELPTAMHSLSNAVKARVQNLSFSYGTNQVVNDVSMDIERNKITALIGPSGCGKTTLLRCFNRMHDLTPNTHYKGSISLFPDNIDLIGKGIDPIEIRMRIGMVFQKPNPFPKTIFENVVYGLRVRGINDRSQLLACAEKALRGAALWSEVQDRLDKPAYALSGGQQQRLCIARALAVEPEILLFDEPTSALDPTATRAIEELVTELKSRVTILIVTHNMQQAQRISDTTAFMYLGNLIEFGRTDDVFRRPQNKLTSDYVSGHFG